jgi:hypothetical protein
MTEPITTSDKGQPIIPGRVQVLRKNCLVLYRIWWTTHYLIGFIGVLTGGLAGLSATSEGGKVWGWAVGAIAAICTSLVTFLGPLQKAERYWKAYHELDQACLEYEYEHKDLNVLIRQAKKVRAIILGGGVTHQVESPDDRVPQPKT